MPAKDEKTVPAQKQDPDAVKKAKGSNDPQDPPQDGKAAAATEAGASEDKQDENGKAKAAQQEEELSEEDLKLKEELEMLVERLGESNTELYTPTLAALKTLIRTSTSSMTAVPKPLKFLKPLYPRLVEIWESWPTGQAKTLLTDILSVLGMTQGTALRYRLLVDEQTGGVSEEEIADWGHEYMRHLSVELTEEYFRRVDEQDATGKEIPTGDLLDLSLRVAQFLLKHNAETDAVDMLIDVEHIESLADDEMVDAESYQRVCQYMVACAEYVDEMIGPSVYYSAFAIYKQHNDLSQALLVAIRIDDEELVRSVFQAAQDPLLRKQLALILARNRRYYDLSTDGSGEIPEDIAYELRSTHLSEHFLYVAKELNLEKPKTPYEILRSPGDNGVFKIHGERSKMNLAAIFVRGFINAGYSNFSDDFSEFASVSARARSVNAAAVHTSLGLGYLWNYHEALQQLDQYIDSTDIPTRAGALLGVGVATNGVHDETDAALGLLGDVVSSDESQLSLRTSAVLGLGFAYAGTCREDIASVIEPLVTDSSLPIDLSATAALALGLVYVGSANGDRTTAILEALMERDANDLSHSYAIFMGLGLAILYIGKEGSMLSTIETVKAIEHPISQTLEALVMLCAYAGTGNVIRIQDLLSELSTRNYDEDEDDDEDADDDEAAEAAASSLVAALTRATEQQEGLEPQLQSDLPQPDDAPRGQDEDVEMTDAPAGPATGGDENAGEATTGDAAKPDNAEESNPETDPATRAEAAKAKALCTLGIAVVAMGENIGEEMVLRHFEHLMYYGDSNVRQAVPLAMGILFASNPQMKVYETLSRYSHEPDFSVAVNAIFAMGLVGAGTLNARVAQLLRQLDEYYARQSDLLFMVRIALGLVNLGKGTLTLSPFTAEKQLLNPVALASLLIVSVALLTPPSKQFMVAEQPGLLYSLSLAMQPRILATLDENLKPLKVTVRVGQAVDTVGQAGKPKQITGWVTQDTPVILSAGERAELEDDEYEPLSSVLEGVVILRKREE